MKNKILFISLILIVMMIFGCELSINSTRIAIFIPTDAEYAEQANLRRKIFYIEALDTNEVGGEYRTVISSVQTADSRVNLDVAKTGTIPILSCVEIEQLETSLEQCPFALGATYPFDSENFNLFLQAKSRAQVAKNLLVLYREGAQIQTINIAKLYETIEKRSPNYLYDDARFYDYAQKNNLSYWSIAPMERFDFVFSNGVGGSSVEDGGVLWKRSSYWTDDILPGATVGTVYAGKWVFIDSENPAHYMWVYMQKDGEYLVQEKTY